MLPNRTPVAVQRCSDVSLSEDEPLAGSAPENAAWLLVEQPPPWGRDALLESRLDPAVAEELGRRAKAAGLKVLLVRRCGMRPAGAERRAFAAWTGAGPFVVSLELANDAALLEPDLSLLARGERLPGAVEVSEPMTLVCTNGRRDACCALHGRRAADALAAARPEETWECTHLGGHRFAATMLCLPSGACFGRLGPEDAVRVAEDVALGRLDLGHLRGISGRPAPAQVAEQRIRTRLGLTEFDAVRIVDVRETEAGVAVVLRTSDGQDHDIELSSRTEAPRRISCAGEPEPVTRWV